MSAYTAGILSIVAIAGLAFLCFTPPGQQILASIIPGLGGTIYDPKTSPFARGKKGGPMGLEDAREFIPEFIDDLVDPEVHNLGQPAQMRAKLGYSPLDLDAARKQLGMRK